MSMKRAYLLAEILSRPPVVAACPPRPNHCLRACPCMYTWPSPFSGSSLSVEARGVPHCSWLSLCSGPCRGVAPRRLPGSALMVQCHFLATWWPPLFHKSLKWALVTPRYVFASVIKSWRWTIWEGKGFSVAKVSVCNHLALWFGVSVIWCGAQW